MGIERLGQTTGKMVHGTLAGNSRAATPLSPAPKLGSPISNGPFYARASCAPGGVPLPGMTDGLHEGYIDNWVSLQQSGPVLDPGVNGAPGERGTWMVPIGGQWRVSVHINTQLNAPYPVYIESWDAEDANIIDQLDSQPDFYTLFYSITSHIWTEKGSRIWVNINTSGDPFTGGEFAIEYIGSGGISL